MATFILIHGAWHGNWCWERLIPLLEAKGHQVLAPDLPGMGEDTTPLSKITLDTWAQFVSNLIKQQKEKVILVGHSRGGIVISQAAEYCAEHIECLIYIAAFLVPNGKTLWEIMQNHPREANRKPDLAFSEDKRSSTIIPEAVKNTFYNTTSEEWIKRAASKIGAEPMSSFMTPLNLRNERFGSLPRGYIECLQDNAIHLSVQRKMIGDLPCQALVSLDTDHSPFYSAPEKLAAEIITMASALSTKRTMGLPKTSIER